MRNPIYQRQIFLNMLKGYSWYPSFKDACKLRGYYLALLDSGLLDTVFEDRDERKWVMAAMADYDIAYRDFVEPGLEHQVARQMLARALQLLDEQKK